MVRCRFCLPLLHRSLRKGGVLLFLWVPFVSLGASAAITEIMYDLPGADSGREWVEVENTGTEPVSFSAWKFFEADTNHTLTLSRGDATTSPHSFAVIADDPAKFLADWPSFAGTLFGSSFSLSNTGETLELRLDGASISQATYASSMGATGDGNSLHKSGNDWEVKAPTPGSGAASMTPTPQSSPQGTASTAPKGKSEDAPPPLATVQSGSAWTFTPQIFVNSFVPQTGIAGAPVIFDAVAVGAKKEPLMNARYIWSFGDGGTLEGKKIHHTYHYPAAYVVMVTASSGEWNATDRAEISIVAPELVIGSIKEGGNGFIEVRNNGASEVDLSGWLLGNGSGFFSIPRGTLIGAKKSIPFPAAITKLSAEQTSTTLLYPNGSVVTRYKETPIVPESVLSEPLKPVPAPVGAASPVVQAAVETATPTPESAPTTPSVVPPQEETELLPKSSELLGAVGATKQRSFSWVLGTALLAAVSVGGYITMLWRQREPSAAEKLRKEAAEYDIIE